MSKRQTGLVVGKDFRPPDGARPLEWCYLTIDLADEVRVSVRVRRNHVPRADIGDVVVFRMPKDPDHQVSRLTRVGSNPGLLPPVSGRGPNR